MLARLVDRGVLRWDETLGEALPDAAPVDRATTLEQLMLGADDATLARVVVRAAGKPWEQLVRDEISRRSASPAASFGPTATGGCRVTP